MLPEYLAPVGTEMSQGASLLLLLLLAVGCNLIRSQDILNCPVCLRVVKAARDLAKRSKEQGAAGDIVPTKVSVAFGQYCALDSIASDDKQFCYNGDTSFHHSALYNLFLITS